MDEDIELYVCSYQTNKLNIHSSSASTEVDLGFSPYFLAFINDTYAIGGHNPPSLQIRRKDNNALMHNIHVLRGVYSLAASPDGLQLCVGMHGGLLLFVHMIVMSFLTQVGSVYIPSLSNHRLLSSKTKIVIPGRWKDVLSQMECL